MNSDMKAIVYEEYGASEAEKTKKRGLLANLFTAEWLIPVGLIMLSAIPLISGTLHMVELATGAEIIPNYERPSVSPLPAILHVISVTLYSILGAFQFVPSFRRRRPDWHRIAGRILIPSGLIAALSGLWMTHFYPFPDNDGEIVYGLRLVFGSAMFLSIVLGVGAIRRWDIVQHRAWMIRGYAIGLGAGTQTLTQLPWVLIFGIPGELPRALLMGASWMINLAVAEWIIRKQLTVQDALPHNFRFIRDSNLGEKTMKVIVCTKYGAPDVLQLREVAKPVPKDNEVLIKVHAATATTAGLAGRTGKPAFARLFSGLTKPKQAILGIELSGEIEAVGKDVTLFQAGDQVFGMTGATTPGAYAEFKCMPEDGALLIKPTSMTYEEAAAVVEGGITALNFLKNRANIQPGQKVLIYGASGSVGTASVQVAKALGAEVTGVCSYRNLDLVKSLGAEHVIDYTEEDFTQNGQSYDVIFDTVGKRSFSQCKESLTPEGLYLDSGNAATILSMLWTSLFSRKKAVLLASYVRSASAIRKDLVAFKALIEAGKIQAVIDRRYPLEQTAEAHRYVETGRKKGNVVITVTDNDKT